MYGLQPIVKPTFTAANRHLMRARRYVFLLPSPQSKHPASIMRRNQLTASLSSKGKFDESIISGDANL